MIRRKGVDLLVTNYHVLTGKHPASQELLSGIPASPDRVLIPFLRRDRTEFCWVPQVHMLYEDYEPVWVEHPDFGSAFDVVALPVEVPSYALTIPYDFEPGPDLALPPGSELAIVGFPEGMSASGITALWKAGSIASEPELDIDGRRFFWIDANTRRGMSGSPVVARRFGGAVMADGNMQLGRSVLDRSVGVYAGRALDAPDMTLGRVWKWVEVQAVIDSAASKVHRRRTRAVEGSLVHSPPAGEDPMVEIDITQSATIPVKNPQGESEQKVITIAQLFKDLVLADQRFGITLDRVRMAAKISAAIDEAESEGTPLQLEDEQYAIVCEAIESPSQAYNPQVARFALPLLESVLEAGQTHDS